MTFFSHHTRNIASGLVFLIVFHSVLPVGLTAAPVSAPIERSVFPLNVGATEPDSIRALARDHGIVSHQFRSTQAPFDGPLVVHINDIHRHAGAQREISSFLLRLVDQKRTRLIALEGAFGPLPVHLFRVQAEAALVRDTVDHQLAQNQLSGALHAALSTPTFPCPLVGVDDTSTYRANVQAFRLAHPFAGENRALVRARQKELEERKDLVYGDRLRDADRAYLEFDAGRCSLSDHLRRLAADLRQISQEDRFPQLALFARLHRSEETFTPAVRAEAQALAHRLVERLTPRRIEQERIHIRGTQGDDATAWLFRLKELSAEAGFAWTSYPNLERYLTYVTLSRGLEASRLLDEAYEARIAVLHALDITAEQRRLVIESRYLLLLGKLIDFSLTDQEWKDYVGLRIAGWNWRLPGLVHFEDFFRHAQTRNNLMADRLLQASAGLGSTETVVLITGGFHGNAIGRRLTSAGRRVVAFTPAIRSETLTLEKASDYLTEFLQESPFSSLARGRRQTVVPEVFSDSVQRRLGGEIIARAARVGRGASTAHRLKPAVLGSRWGVILAVSIGGVVLLLLLPSGMWEQSLGLLFARSSSAAIPFSPARLAAISPVGLLLFCFIGTMTTVATIAATPLSRRTFKRNIIQAYRILRYPRYRRGYLHRSTIEYSGEGILFADDESIAPDSRRPRIDPFVFHYLRPFHKGDVDPSALIVAAGRRGPVGDLLREIFSAHGFLPTSDFRSLSKVGAVSILNDMLALSDDRLDVDDAGLQDFFLNREVSGVPMEGETEADLLEEGGRFVAIANRARLAATRGLRIEMQAQRALNNARLRLLLPDVFTHKLTLNEAMRDATKYLRVIERRPKAPFFAESFRVVDAAGGSALDISSYEEFIPKDSFWLQDKRSTLTIASADKAWFYVESLRRSEGEGTNIVIDSDNYGVQNIKGPVQLNPDGTTVRGMKDAAGYVLVNLFNLRDMKITIATPPLVKKGGMESSNNFLAGLITIGSILSGANLNEADIWLLATCLENEVFGGITGGQGAMAALRGGGRHYWLKEKGHDVVFTVSRLSEAHLKKAELHMALLQAGPPPASLANERSGPLINQMWTDMMNEATVSTLLSITERYDRAITKNRWKDVARLNAELGSIRDQMCRQWLSLMLDAYNGETIDRRTGRPLPAIAYELARRVRSADPFYEPIRVVMRKERFRRDPEALRQLSFYSYPPIDSLVQIGKDFPRRIVEQRWKQVGPAWLRSAMIAVATMWARLRRDPGVAIFPLGAGGVEANLVLVAPKGTEQAEEYFGLEGVNLKEIRAEDVKGLEDDDVSSRGYMKMRLENSPWSWPSRLHNGEPFPTPKGPDDVWYDQWTGRFIDAKAMQPSLRGKIRYLWKQIRSRPFRQMSLLTAAALAVVVGVGSFGFWARTPAPVLYGVPRPVPQPSFKTEHIVRQAA